MSCTGSWKVKQPCQRHATQSTWTGRDGENESMNEIVYVRVNAFILDLFHKGIKENFCLSLKTEDIFSWKHNFLLQFWWYFHLTLSIEWVLRVQEILPSLFYNTLLNLPNLDKTNKCIYFFIDSSVWAQVDGYKCRQVESEWRRGKQHIQMGKVESSLDVEMRLMFKRKTWSKERKKGGKVGRERHKENEQGKEKDEREGGQGPPHSLQERLQLIIYIICHCALHWTTQQTAPVI